MKVELSEDQKIWVANSKMLFKVMRDILMREDYLERGHEHVWTCCLSPDSKLLNVELVSLGAINESNVKPMQVYRIAVQKGAVKIILVHNHCFDSVEPSKGDINITDRLYQSGRILDIELIDHLIINEKGFYSFEENGLMEELSKSLKYVPLYEEQERLRREKKEIEKKAREEGFVKGHKKGKREGIKEGEKQGVKKGEKKKAVKIAKALKKQSDPVSKITKLTGLTPEEIEKL